MENTTLYKRVDKYIMKNRNVLLKKQLR